mmetsp:Transcript_32413/g.64234  ORF Transcript_32413/g.64234 Transcript_32413/m.64234 type:complete len:226 (+) Transcript_32413:360-1037(+)
MGCRVDGVVPLAGGRGPAPPWADEFDYRTLYVVPPGAAGPVSEVAMVHRPTRTLICADAVVYVPDAPPPILDTYFSPGTTADPSFWPRTVLQAVFLPLRMTADGRYPGYEALRGKLVRAPILRLLDARAPEATREWVDGIASMDFDRIVSSHFAGPVDATPVDVRSAFGYLYGSDSGTSTAATMAGLPPIECLDWEFLDSINDFIDKNGLGAPSKFKISKGCVVK